MSSEAKKIMVSARIEPAVYEQLNEAAKSRGLTRTQYMEKALRRVLAAEAHRDTPAAPAQGLSSDPRTANPSEAQPTSDANVEATKVAKKAAKKTPAKKAAPKSKAAVERKKLDPKPKVVSDEAKAANEEAATPSSWSQTQP